MHRDIELDRPGIERLLREGEVAPSDIRAMDSWPVRLIRLRHVVGDNLPFIGHVFAEPALRGTMLEATATSRTATASATRFARCFMLRSRALGPTTRQCF